MTLAQFGIGVGMFMLGVTLALITTLYRHFYFSFFRMLGKIFWSDRP
jgi:hypothetical protein